MARDINRDNVALLLVVDVFPPPEERSEEGAGKRCGERSRNDLYEAEDKTTPASVDSHADEGYDSAGPNLSSGRVRLSPGEGVSCGGDGKKSSPVIARPAAAARLVVANTHLLFNPKRGDIKTAQLMVLTDRVET